MSDAATIETGPSAAVLAAYVAAALIVFFLCLVAFWRCQQPKDPDQPQGKVAVTDKSNFRAVAPHTAPLLSQLRVAPSV